MVITRTRYLKKIIPFIDKNLIKVLTGIRRAGKTVLLHQVAEIIMKRGVKSENIISINMESMKYRRLAAGGALYDYIVKQSKAAEGRTYIMLDEVQDVKDWQIIVNSLRVDIDCDIYITGSNSTLFADELASHLSGRYVRFSVYPFSFAEAKEITREIGASKSDDELFADYIKYGGMPQRFYLPDAQSVESYLFDLFDAVANRDVISRHSIRDVSALRRVTLFMLDNIGNPFSARKITGAMVSRGVKITTPTVQNYIAWLSEAFIIHAAARYDIKGKDILTSTEKYYAGDLGIRNIVKSSEKIDLSKLFENVVYLEMMSRGYEMQVGKLDDLEIDFIARRGNEKIYIQVAYTITDEDEAREFGNLEMIGDNYPKWVISNDRIDMSRGGIIHKNIIDFLLEES